MNTDISVEFLTELPIGFYILDAEDRIVFVNDAWLELHGYKSLDQVRGRNVRFVHVYPQKVEDIRESINTNGWVKDQVFELIRPNGEHFWVSVYSTEIIDVTGRYNGRRGIVLDATEREIHRRIMNEIPVGYYAVERQHGVDIITYCNQEFAEMFGFASPAEAVGVDISRLYRHRSDYNSFQNRIEHGPEHDVHHQLEVQSLDGQKSFWMEASTRVQRDSFGKPIGRIGVVRDLSQDEPLKQLRQDLGNVLHTVTTSFIAIESDMEVALEALGAESLKKSFFTKSPKHVIEQLNMEMREPLAQLNRSLIELIEKLANRKELTELYIELQNLQSTLARVENTEKTFYAHALHITAKKIVVTCDNGLKKQKVPRVPLKQVQQDAYKIMGVLAKLRLQERIGNVITMDHAVRALRAFVTVPAKEARTWHTEFKLWTIVEQAMRNLHDFANNRGVTFLPRSNPSQAIIKADEQEILRVVTNILHNAVKYSWSRENGTWVEVKLFQSGGLLILEIENFGLPIPQDELESDLIYLFGYRSRLSTDRGRVGTGVGLADARQTLRRYSGSIELHSRPASPFGDAEKLDPFLTTAIMTIPKIERE